MDQQYSIVYWGGRTAEQLGLWSYHIAVARPNPVVFDEVLDRHVVQRNSDGRLVATEGDTVYLKAEARAPRRDLPTSEWEDELSLASPPPSQSPSWSKFKPATPLKRAAPASDHELSPTPKRLNAPHQASASSPRTPASQARLDAILRAQGLSVAASAPDPTPRRSSSPSPSSSRSVGAPQASQTSPYLPSWFESSPTPSYRPATPPPTAERTEPQWPPQTPPSSRGPPVQSEPAKRARNEKSVEKQNRHDFGTSSDSDARLDADPFRSPSGSETRSGGSEPRGKTTVAPPNSLPSADPGKQSAAAQVLDQANRTAAYITQLELRLSAAEKSNDAKALRMERLQEEIDQLQARNTELERILADLT
ncbi:hypothetical protein B0H17DRAFT_1194252 [Mycena rosella]|uniref:Uncharacterized protein n=1 Tax=Mycena rosella TaxID=1033263 RepID=A0AAD7GN86_MYCRO|nr:hypothetical protein B0H17DRAFT_1194252 [Mycena rosella]